MGNKKDAEGVVATIERLTGKYPCPGYLRNALNKYLRCANLFPGAINKSGKQLMGKLKRPDTDVLVLNVLRLDEIFRGNTKLVSRIVRGEIAEDLLAKEIFVAQAEIERRRDIYSYWSHKLSGLKGLLTDDATDLRSVLLDPQVVLPSNGSTREPIGFAMRAIAMLEENEERGRLGLPTADEFVERADAYFALGDLVGADVNAVQALEINCAHPKAWFIRVMVALRLRGNALNQMRHHDMVAQEIAEPMSSQERWAREMAGEEADRAARQHQTLAKILPKALLHWPTLGNGGFDQLAMRTQVRDLFIDHMFDNAIKGTRRHLKPENLYRLNGLEPEWQLAIATQPYLAMSGAIEQECPFDGDEMQALRMLFKEEEAAVPWFFHPLDGASLAKALKMLHLRWILGDAGYAERWGALKKSMSCAPAASLERSILCDGTMSRFWHQHLARNEGEQGVLTDLARWQMDSAAHHREKSSERMLNQYALFFHRQFARKNYANCAQICALATVHTREGPLSRTGLGSMSHPFDESILMPAGSFLYWRYLAALSAVCAVASENYTQDDVSLILDAEALLVSFSDTSGCFWQESEEYEDGGGDDWFVSPYGIDLRIAESWLPAIRVARENTSDSISKGVLVGLEKRMTATLDQTG